MSRCDENGSKLNRIMYKVQEKQNLMSPYEDIGLQEVLRVVRFGDLHLCTATKVCNTIAPIEKDCTAKNGTET